MHELKKEGYEVSRGYFRLYTTDDCPYSWATMESCYGNNPAAPYVSPVLPHPFYLYYFARDCTGLETLTDGNCLSITDEMIPICPEPGDPSCHLLVLSERDYIRPGTQRGPNSLLELRPVVLRLHRPAQ